jgi:hypothetical protein
MPRRPETHLNATFVHLKKEGFGGRIEHGIDRTAWADTKKNTVQLHLLEELK